jgi:putative tryptophan/tyrosine transport system substrate-binding protein
MRRREFTTLLGGAAATWPLAVRAQQPAMPVIGYLTTGSPQSDAVPFLAAFRQGLGETGYVEGQNVTIEYRWAEFQYERLSAMAADLAHRQVTAIATIGGTPPALAAKAATSTIPIVFYFGIDPVEYGLVASLNRPNGNMTGVAALQAELVAKRYRAVTRIGAQCGRRRCVGQSNQPLHRDRNASAAGRLAFSWAPTAYPARKHRERDRRGLRNACRTRAGALLVSADLFLFSRREQVVALAAQHALPSIYGWREYAALGGTMSYGPSLFDAYRLVGVYIGKILKGAKPADLPVQQTTKVEFVINLRTAKTLGLTFPLPLSGRADEVIE